MLRSVEETYIWALFDRAPLDRWSRGRVTLLGAAAWIYEHDAARSSIA